MASPWRSQNSKKFWTPLSYVLWVEDAKELCRRLSIRALSSPMDKGRLESEGSDREEKNTQKEEKRKMNVSKNCIGECLMDVGLSIRRQLPH